MRVWCLFVFIAVAQCFQPGESVYSIQFHSASSLKGWSTADCATLVPGYEGNQALQVSVPAPANGPPASCMIATVPFDVSQFQNYSLFVTVLLKMDNVSQPQDEWNGVKVMLHTVGTSGEQMFTNANNVYGTSGWNGTIENYVAPILSDAANASLVVGLQDSYGTVLFDSINITIFRIPPPPLPTPPVNPPPPYTGHPNVPRYRGVMSPQYYYDPDIQNLGLNWKANLMRWQLEWGGASFDDRNNLTLYDAWLNAKLNQTDYLLAACIKYGIKVVVDLHCVPGGRVIDKGDMFLLNETYQQHFLEVWYNISHRYKGHPAVWGYDIANEPLQLWPGAPGVMQWQQLAEATTQLIRSIDQNITIIIEAEGGGSPYAFETLRPVNDSKVVYEVHMYDPSGFTFQGIPGYNISIGPVYPGVVDGAYWNITDLQTKSLKYARAFQLAFNVHMYAGEFSAIRWAANATAVNYLRDCISIWEEWGWDWTYHAYREYQGWSVEYDENFYDNYPVNYTTTREALLRGWYANNVYPYPPYKTSLPQHDIFKVNIGL